MGYVWDTFVRISGENLGHVHRICGEVWGYRWKDFEQLFEVKHTENETHANSYHFLIFSMRSCFSYGGDTYDRKWHFSGPES